MADRIITSNAVSEYRVAINELNVELVTALPTSPFNGQVVDYVADAINGVIWRLRYRAASASAYKWEFVGGSDLYARNDNQDNVTGTSYAYYNGPSITAPFAGDYDIRLEGRYGTGGSSIAILVAVQIGGGTISDDDSSRPTILSGEILVPAGRTLRKTAAAGDVIREVARMPAAGTGSVSWREMTVRPVRVG